MNKAPCGASLALAFLLLKISANILMKQKRQLRLKPAVVE
jgi:hypothetical protein